MIYRYRALALVVIATATGCGGARAPSDAPLPTPAVHELARLQQEGRIDPVRLTCAAVELAPVIEDLAPILPVLWGASTPSYSFEGASHARSVQDGMAASDTRNAAMRNASQARQTAAYATRVGDTRLATLATNYAIGAMRTAQDADAGPGSIGIAHRPAGPWHAENTPILEEYAALFADLLTAQDEAPTEVRDRIAEIGRESPNVMEAYAGLLLEAYADPDLRCAPPPA
mgnify:FL=1